MRPMLGVSMVPHGDVGGGLCVGAVLVRDSRKTMGTRTRRIYGNNQWRWVRPKRRYPIWEQRGNECRKHDGTNQRERGTV